MSRHIANLRRVIPHFSFESSERLFRRIEVSAPLAVNVLADSEYPPVWRIADQRLLTRRKPIPVAVSLILSSAVHPVLPQSRLCVCLQLLGTQSEHGGPLPTGLEATVLLG